MIDHYEMPHPDADACDHAGVGKACRPCREVLDNLHRISLRDTPAGRALMAEAWQEGAAMGGAFRRSTADTFPINPYREEATSDGPEA